MVGFLIIGSLVAILWAVTTATSAASDRRFVSLLFAGFFFRLVLHLAVRNVQFFSHIAGGDSVAYEYYARAIGVLWERGGFHFVTADEIPELGATSLPSNMFALIFYCESGITGRVACTALVALAAALTALNVYTLAIAFGADRKAAFTFSTLLYFTPSLLFYTADTYKDGLVICLTIGALGSGLRLARQLTARDLVVGIVCVISLWYVRFYLIYVTVAPLLVGTVGMSSKGILRSVIVGLLLVIVGVALAGYSGILQMATERATETFQRGTSLAVVESNATGGSGVLFDDGGSPFGALPAKIAYTLFAPFPWAGGSLGFQIGKLDAFVWYYTVYRAIRAFRQTERRLVLMIATFVLPCTLMYAMSMSNVGLIVRQRLVIVVATTILAALYKPITTAVTVTASKDPRRARALARARAGT